MGFSRRNKIWLTGSLVSTSLQLVMRMKKDQRRMKPSASVARSESTFDLIQLETSLHWWTLSPPLLRPFQKNTPQKLNTACQSFHPCHRGEPRRQRLDPRGHSSDGDWWERSNYEAWAPRISNTSRTDLNSMTVSCIVQVSCQLVLPKGLRPTVPMAWVTYRLKASSIMYGPGSSGLELQLI